MEAHKITPISKPGKDVCNLKNWRQISQLSTISKIYENINNSRLNDLIKGWEIFSKLSIWIESGYVSMPSHGLNNSKLTTIVTLDIRSAFDTVWHDVAACQILF